MKQQCDCSFRNICYVNLPFFIQGAAVLVHGTIANLFKYTLLWNFASAYKLVRGNIITTVRLATETGHLCTFEQFYEASRFSIVVLLCLSQPIRVKTILDASAADFSLQFFDYTSSPSVLIQVGYKFPFPIAESKIQRICVHLLLFKFIYAIEIGENL